MSYCQKCGTENAEENKFCFNCGQALRQNAETDEPATVTEETTAGEEGNEQIDQCQSAPVFVQPKKIPTLAEKSATASLVLSIVGAVIFFALPIQILALILGIKGIRSERRIRACVGIGLAIFGMVCFVATALFIIANYQLIVNSDIFAYIYFTLFGY